jgi:hypothetical protein
LESEYWIIPIFNTAKRQIWDILQNNCDKTIMIKRISLFYHKKNQENVIHNRKKTAKKSLKNEFWDKI